MPSVLAAEGYVIPHDEAYASAKRHHRSTPLSPETLSPAPVGPALSICRPSESVPQNQATARCRLGMGAYQECARNISIAVQKLDADWSGAAGARKGQKGHGRGKVCGPPLRLGECSECVVLPIVVIN
jgi:hypothetical protein